MKIINVIEIIDGSVSSVESFIISTKKEEKTQVVKAEKLFADKLKENCFMSKSAMEDCIEDGYFTAGDYFLSLTWSDIVK